MSTTPEEQKTADPALSAFATSLIFDTAIFVSAVLAFGFVRSRVKHIFEPRTYFVTKEKRSPSIPPSVNPLAWILPVMQISDSTFLAVAGLDHYLFMRYLRMCLRLFTVLAVVGLLILGPVTVVGQNPDSPPSLSLLTIGNITAIPRFWAPTILTAIFTFGMLWMLHSEVKVFLGLRQEYLRQNAPAPFSRVVMIRDIPSRLLRAHAIAKLFDRLPGGVERVYLSRDPGQLPALVRERNKALARLESTETQYVRSFQLRKGPPVLKRLSRRRQTQSHVPPLSLIRLREIEHFETSLSIEVPSVSSVSAAGTTRSETPATTSTAATSTAATSTAATSSTAPILNALFEDSSASPGTASERPAANPPHAAPLKSSLRTSSAPRVRASMARFANPPAIVVTDLPPPKRFSTLDAPTRGSVLAPRFSSLRTIGSNGLPVGGRIGRGRRRRPSLRGLGGDKDGEGDGVELRNRGGGGESSEEEELSARSEEKPLPAAPSSQPQTMEFDLSDLPPRPTYRRHAFANPVDAIRRHRANLVDLNKRVAEARAALINNKASPPLGTAFVLFREQQAAQMCVLGKEGGWRGKVLRKRTSEVAPRDVVWRNLSIGRAERFSKELVGGVITALLVVFWGILVAAVTALANLDMLSVVFPPIKYVLGLSPVLTGIIQGLIPSMVLSTLMGLLPLFLIYLCQFEGIMTYSRIERAVQWRYFFFLVVNVLLVVTVAGSLLGSLGAFIHNPTTLIPVLAKSLPMASTFMINYILLQGLVGSAIELLQVYRWLFNWIRLRFFCDTPRKIFMENHPRALLWGTVLPQQALIFSIGLAFSTVAPLTLAGCAIYFAVFYLVYRHQMLYVYTTALQTGGLHYPLALMQPFAGLIIHLLMMIGIMFGLGAVGQGVICVLMLVLVVAALVYGRWKYGPQSRFLPEALDAPTAPGPDLGLSSIEEDDGEALAATDPKLDDLDGEELGNPVSLSSRDEALLRDITDHVDAHDTDVAFRSSTMFGWEDEASKSSGGAPKLPPLAIHRQQETGARTSALYLHPYLTAGPPKVWLPGDVLGIAESEATELAALGLDAMVDGGGGNGEDPFAGGEAVARREEISRQVDQIDASVTFPQILGGGSMNWFH